MVVEAACVDVDLFVEKEANLIFRLADSQFNNKNIDID